MRLSFNRTWLSALLTVAFLFPIRADAQNQATPPTKEERPDAGPNPFDQTSRRRSQASVRGPGGEIPRTDAASTEQASIHSIKAEMEAARDELVKTKQMIDEVMKEQKLLAKERELPPLKDAEIKFFSLKFVKAAQAADTIGTLLGREPVRIAIDDRTNSLIVVGKAESLTIIEALLSRLDNEAQAESAPKAAAATLPVSSERQTLLLRVFWLANGVDNLDSADGYLPPPVINSLAKLGLADARLVTQTVNSLSVEEGGSPVEFSTNVPAMLFEQPVTLVSSGTMGATSDGRAEVDMQLSVGGAGVNCELKGSLATPMGHFMVLGTANSVIPEYQAVDPAAAEGGMGGMPMGRGGEMGRGMGRRGEGGGFGMAMGGMPAAKYNASRFAFVVQVIEAESFEPGEEGQ